jgi:cytochrome c oxidase assembly protein subunit 15
MSAQFVVFWQNVRKHFVFVFVVLVKTQTFLRREPAFFIFLSTFVFMYSLRAMKLLTVFRAVVPIALATVLLVILAGGIVRTTGSGMGCPDWPKCFGQYIPPTHISELPADYKTRFAVKGKEIADFEPFKTWVEYVNRLLGALLGVFVAVQLVASLSRWKQDKATTLLCVGMLVMTGFVGWLGSVVVATDLQPVKITAHMLSALMILALSLVILQRTRNAVSPTTQNVMRSLRWWLVLALVLTLAQIIMGTQVREQIDEIAKSFGGERRDLWIDRLTDIFKVHRSFSLVILAVNGWICYRVFQTSRTTPTTNKGEQRVKGLAFALSALIVAEILTGVVMAYLNVPKAAQPVHLLLASGMFAVQVSMLLLGFGGAHRHSSEPLSEPRVHESVSGSMPI